MDDTFACLPLEDDNYNVAIKHLDGCCTLGAYLAFTVPPLVCILSCPFLVYCFRNKWKCTILPGLFLVWIITIVLFTATFFSTTMDTLDQHTRYQQTNVTLCETDIQLFECEKGEHKECYRLSFWLSFSRDYRTREYFRITEEYFQRWNAVKRQIEVEERNPLLIYYDPLIRNVITIENGWSNAFKTGLVASALALLGFFVSLGFIIYFHVYPTTRRKLQQLRRKKEDIEMENLPKDQPNV